MSPVFAASDAAAASGAPRPRDRIDYALLAQYLAPSNPDETNALAERLLGPGAAEGAGAHGPGLWVGQLANKAAMLRQSYDPRTKFTYFSARTGLIQQSSLATLAPHLVGTPDALSASLAEPFWLDVYAPTAADMAILARTFAIHPLTVEDMTTDDTRDKCEAYENYLFLCVRTVAELDDVPLSPDKPGFAAMAAAAAADDGIRFHEAQYYMLLFGSCIVTVRYEPLDHAFRVILRLVTSSSLSAVAAAGPVAASAAAAPGSPTAAPPAAEVSLLRQSDEQLSPGTPASADSESMLLLLPDPTKARAAVAADRLARPASPEAQPASGMGASAVSDPRGLAPDWVAYALLDDIVDTVRPIIKALEVDVDGIDDLAQILPWDEQADLVNRMRRATKKVTQLIRLLHFKEEVVKSLMHRCRPLPPTPAPSPPRPAFLHPATAVYLRDILDHLLTLHQSLTMAKETVTSAHASYHAQLSVAMANVANEANSLMKRVTTLGMMLAPLTVVAGAFGMNVHIPGQNSDTDDPHYVWFWGMLGIMAGGVLITGVIARRFGYL
ncbi:Mg(2+) transporter [Allomyces arbusculus]|nr:Mg(2+) transporter [Allomyces arbusculus]